MNEQIEIGNSIPDRFKREVVLHVIKNVLPINNNIVPLLCGIHGPSGEGKTFQCEQVLSEMGTRVFLISGGQLESDNAGEPARLIRANYIKASRVLENKESILAAIVINDIDTGLGDWGEMVQTTVNRQTVFGELMHLVDYPTSVEGRVTRRVPIIITGNDFTKLYEPLVRPGRMVSFCWTPTLDEKATIVSHIFNGIIDIEECRKLIEEMEEESRKVPQLKLSSLPIAAYSHLKSTLADDHLWTLITEMGISETISLIGKGSFPVVKKSFSLDDIMLAGKHLIQSGLLFNHLWRNK